MLDPNLLDEIFSNLIGKDVDAKIQAVSKIYKEFRPLLFKKLRYKFRSLSENDVQDIVQEAFLKVYTTSALPSSARQLPSWILMIAENTALDLFRKAYVKNEIAWPQDEGDDDESSTESNFLRNLTEEKLANKNIVDGVGAIVSTGSVLNRGVEKCVDEGMSSFSLKFPEREAILSLALDGYSIADIALVYKRSEAAMKQFIYESKKKLAPFIASCLEEIR
jgi:DNA-directed RNA polymerase specialized sigma24 family protein